MDIATEIKKQFDSDMREFRNKMILGIFGFELFLFLIGAVVVFILE